MHPSALHTLLSTHGAQFPFDGASELASSFGNTEAEHAAIMNGTGLIDLSPFGRYHLTGRDRVRYLHGMVTHDVEKLEPGQGRYATVITANGRTITDLWFYAFDEHLSLVFPPSTSEAALKHLDFYLIADKADFVDVGAQLTRLSLQGPKAADVLTHLGLPTPPEQHAHAAGTLNGVAVTIYEADRCGKGGYDLEVAFEHGVSLWEAAAAAGATPTGMSALNIARVEAAIPWAGHELVEKVIPMEVGLTETAISFKKGCYIGQEVLAKIKYRGKVNRLLVQFDAPEGVDEGDRLFFNGRNMGWVSSLVTSPNKGRVALGILHRKAIEGEGDVTIGEDDAAPVITPELVVADA